MKNDKKIQKLAKQIANLENNLQKGNDVEKYETQLEEIMGSLTPEEFFLIDEYIVSHHMVKNDF